MATLDEFGVPKAEQEELLGLLGPLHGDIVEVESPQTGAPLPETYEPAPALTWRARDSELHRSARRGIACDAV